MMEPIPLTKPDTTGWRIKWTRSPAFIRPSPNCTRPPTSIEPSAIARSPPSTTSAGAKRTALGTVGGGHAKDQRQRQDIHSDHQATEHVAPHVG